MKKALAVLILLLGAAYARAEVIKLHATGTSITASGFYGIDGKDTAVNSNWVECQASQCDGRVFQVGSTGDAFVTWECKAQLSDTDEQAFPCYGPYEMVNSTTGFYATLARAGFYRLSVTNYGSGSYKAFIIKNAR